MIIIKLDEQYIDVSGHAPKVAGHSDNIVCAAVSAMTLTVVDALEEIAGENISRIAEESGHIRAEWFSVTEKGRMLLDAYIMGVSNIANSYPGTINVSDERLVPFRR